MFSIIAVTISDFSYQLQYHTSCVKAVVICCVE